MSRITKLRFDPQQLVVFRHPVGARWSAGLDLTHIQSDC
jgi:hypothetical protein